jgi:hypothetical protein
VVEIANCVTFTQSGSPDIFDSRPIEYLLNIRENYLAALGPMFIPLNEQLWIIEKYEEFLAKRRQLMMEGINDYLDRLCRYSNYGQRVSYISLGSVLICRRIRRLCTR